MVDCFGYDQGTIKFIVHLGSSYLGMGGGNSASNSCYLVVRLG